MSDLTRVDLIYGYSALAPRITMHFVPETRKERIVRGVWQVAYATWDLALRMGLILTLAMLTRAVLRHG